QSQQNNANKADNIMDVTPEEVARVMDEAGVSALIHGHTHRPNVHQVQMSSGFATRWGLGACTTTGWLIRASAAAIDQTSYDRNPGVEAEFRVRVFDQQLFFRPKKRDALADILPGIQLRQTQVILEVS